MSALDLDAIEKLIKQGRSYILFQAPSELETGILDAVPVLVARVRDLERFLRGEQEDNQRHGDRNLQVMRLLGVKMGDGGVVEGAERVVTELANAIAEIDRLRNQFICLECGTGAKVDDDGACTTCGADCLVIAGGVLRNAESVIDWYRDEDVMLRASGDRVTADYHANRALKTLHARVEALGPLLRETLEWLDVATESPDVEDEDDQRRLFATIDRVRSALESIDAPGLRTFDLAEFYNAKVTWSRETFGPGDRYAGVIAHIRKELDEIELEPSDPAEWIDVVLLAMDGAWRSAGLDGGEFVAVLEAKQGANRMRTWPDWRTLNPGDVSEHVKTQDTPQRDLRAKIAAMASVVYAAKRFHQCWTTGHTGEHDSIRIRNMLLAAVTDYINEGGE